MPDQTTTARHAHWVTATRSTVAHAAASGGWTVCGLRLWSVWDAAAETRRCARCTKSLATTATRDAAALADVRTVLGSPTFPQVAS